MRKMKSVVPFLLLMIVLTGAWKSCDAQNQLVHAAVERFVALYEDGSYRAAADSLGGLLPLLAGTKDELTAYKYIGFSYAMLNLVDKAKQTFKSALAKFPEMGIDTLAVPPNIAIVFNQARLERKLESIDTASSQKPVVFIEKKNVAAPTVILSISIISAIASGELFYAGYQQYQKYRSINTPDQGLLDRYYSASRSYYVGGAACAALTAVLTPISIYLYVKKEPPQRIKVSFAAGNAALAWKF